MRHAILILLIIKLFAALLPAQANPFFDRPSAAGAEQAEHPPGDASAEPDHGPMGALQWGDGFLGRLWADSARTLSTWQRNLNRRLGLFLRTVSERGLSVAGWFGVLTFAFLFGLLHAVLPGHRKSVLISYCIADKARVAHGIGLGFLFAAMHALSAVVIVLVTVSLVEVSLGSTVARISRVTQIVSSILLLGIGATFCYLTGREIFAHMRGADHAGQSHAGGVCGAVAGPNPSPRNIRWVPVVLSTGIIPCPITTALLLFAVSVNAVAIGLAAVIALSAGLGVALAALAILTIFVKERVLALLERKAGHLLHAGVELIGGVMILGVGAITLMLLL